MSFEIKAADIHPARPAPTIQTLGPSGPALIISDTSVLIGESIGEGFLLDEVNKDFTFSVILALLEGDEAAVDDAEEEITEFDMKKYSKIFAYFLLSTSFPVESLLAE